MAPLKLLAIRRIQTITCDEHASLNPYNKEISANQDVETFYKWLVKMIKIIWFSKVFGRVNLTHNNINP